tara:strand:- start:34 stop:591 length:558 start_codon:yes stop_codon:yes gene_type:complete
MKKRIKITKRLIKEAMEDGTMPPMGKPVRTPTEKVSAEDILADKEPTVVNVPADVADALQAAFNASKNDPTQKMRLTDKLKAWMQGLFAPSRPSYSDEEIESQLATQNNPPPEKEEDTLTPAQKAQIQINNDWVNRANVAKLGPEQSDMFPAEEEMFVDAPEEEEEIDPDAYRLQEVARRHFKKD